MQGGPACKGGGGVCIQGVYIREGGVGQTPPHQILWDTVNERAVRIILECILVLKNKLSLYEPKTAKIIFFIF